MAEDTKYNSHYRNGGFGYDESIDAWRPWVARYYVREFGLEPGMKLLDVGCGDGFWAMLLDEHDIEVTGIDQSAGGIEVAQSRPVKQATFVVHNIKNPLPFPDETFDVAFMRGLSLFHESDPLDGAERLLPGIARVVKPGGLLLTSIYTQLTGDKPDGSSVYHHKASTLMAALETVAELVKLSSEGRYYQFAARVS